MSLTHGRRLNLTFSELAEFLPGGYCEIEDLVGGGRDAVLPAELDESVQDLLHFRRHGVVHRIAELQLSESPEIHEPAYAMCTGSQDNSVEHSVIREFSL